MILRPYCSYLTIENIWNCSIILLIFGNGNHFNIYDLMYELKRLMQWKLIDSLKICHQTSPQIMSSSDQNTVIYILILLLWRSSRYNQQPEGKKDESLQSRPITVSIWNASVSFSLCSTSRSSLVGAPYGGNDPLRCCIVSTKILQCFLIHTVKRFLIAKKVDVWQLFSFYWSFNTDPKCHDFFDSVIYPYNTWFISLEVERLLSLSIGSATLLKTLPGNNSCMMRL